MPIIGATVTNTFSGLSGQVKMSTLDTNFQNILTFLNTMLNYSNYLADVGAANALAVSTDGSLTYATTAGMILWILVGFNNTGATTLAVNGGSADAVVKAGGAALASGDLKAGYVYGFVRLASNWQLL